MQRRSADLPPSECRGAAPAARRSRCDRHARASAGSPSGRLGAARRGPAAARSGAAAGRSRSAAPPAARQRDRTAINNALPLLPEANDVTRKSLCFISSRSYAIDVLAAAERFFTFVCVMFCARTSTKTNAFRTYAVDVLPSAERYFIFLCFSFLRSTAQKRKALNQEVP